MWSCTAEVTVADDVGVSLSNNLVAFDETNRVVNAVNGLDGC